MKKLILLPILISLSCKSKKLNQESSSSKFEFGIEINARVSKIDSIQDYYLVFVENDTNYFKIVSDKKQPIPFDGLKIETGKKYDFRVKQLTGFPKKNQDQYSVMNYLDITRCKDFKNTKICTESRFEIATSSNLKGLYIIKSDKTP